MTLERFLAELSFSDSDALQLKSSALNIWKNSNKQMEECWFRAAVSLLESKGVIKHMPESEMLLDSSKSLKYTSSILGDSNQLSFDIPQNPNYFNFRGKK